MNNNFKGIWIPKEVLCNKNLGQTEKLLISSIFTLDNGRGCYATNAYFSELIGISKDRVSKVINKLIKLSYLNSKIIYKLTAKEVERRVLKVNSRKFIEGLCESTFSPPDENSQEKKYIKKIIVAIFAKQKKKSQKIDGFTKKASHIC